MLDNDLFGNPTKTVVLGAAHPQVGHRVGAAARRRDRDDQTGFVADLPGAAIEQEILYAWRGHAAPLRGDDHECVRGLQLGRDRIPQRVGRAAGRLVPEGQGIAAQTEQVRLGVGVLAREHRLHILRDLERLRLRPVTATRG